MKRTFICALAILLTVPVFSQFKKGDKLIGVYVGSTGFSSGKSNTSYSYTPITYDSKSKNFSIGVGPEIGWFITDNLVVGTSLSIGFSSGKYENSNSGTTSTNQSNAKNVYFSAGPSARLYLGKSNEKGRPFVWLGGGLGFYPSDNGNASNTPLTYEYDYKSRKYFNWNIGPRVGYEHLLSKSVGLQYYIGYIYSKSKSTYEYDYITGGTDYSYTSTSSNGGINLGIGAVVHLEKKRK